MKKLLKPALITLLASCFTPATLYAQTATAAPRTITVSGESHAQVAPDQAILSMSLVSRDASLQVAKQHNDALAQRLLTIVTQFQIPKEKIATSNIYIAPEYAYDTKDGEQKQRLLGYIVNRSMRITIDSLDIHEKLLSAIVSAQIDQVNGIEFKLADTESHAAKLRVQAFENAKGKAASLAQAAGGKLGPALTISTISNSTPITAPQPMMAKALSADAESTAPNLPGMVALSESVNVTFALE